MVKWILIGIIGFVVVAVTVHYRKNIRPIKAAEEATAEINRRAPIDVGKGVRVEAASFEQRVLRVQYQLTEVDASEVKWAELQPKLKQVSKTTFCNNPQLKATLMAGVTVQTIWIGKDRKQIGRQAIDHYDC